MTIQCQNCDKENKTFPSLHCQYKIDIVNISFNKPIWEIKHIVKLFSQMFKKIRRWYKLYKKRCLSRNENQNLMWTQLFFRQKKFWDNNVTWTRSKHRNINTKRRYHNNNIYILLFYVILFLPFSIYYSSPPVQSFNIYIET